MDYYKDGTIETGPTLNLCLMVFIDVAEQKINLLGQETVGGCQF